jgi:hypothetical protein
MSLHLYNFIIMYRAYLNIIQPLVCCIGNIFVYFRFVHLLWLVSICFSLFHFHTHSTKQCNIEHIFVYFRFVPFPLACFDLFQFISLSFTNVSRNNAKLASF